MATVEGSPEKMQWIRRRIVLDPTRPRLELQNVRLKVDIPRLHRPVYAPDCSASTD